MRSIFLVGFMGSGKTTSGRILAERLGWSFVDLDAQIVESEGRSVSEIFAAGGEPAFRSAERKALEQVAMKEQAVIATGGGLFADLDNRRLIAESDGWTVFLDVSWKTLVARLKSQTSGRPMWTGAESTRELFDQRQGAYHMADAVVRVTADDDEYDVADRIIRLKPELACAI